MEEQTLSLGNGVTIPFQSEESKTMEIERLKEENKKLKEELDKWNKNICHKCKTPFIEENKLFYKLQSYKSLPQFVGFKCGKCNHIQLNKELTNEQCKFILFAEWNRSG